MLEVRLAYAADAAIRESASSGGAARTLIAAALERGGFDGAYALVRNDRYPWAEGKLIEAPVDPSQFPNSLYLPILANRNLPRVGNGRMILTVGTRCQLLGARKFFRKRSVRLVKISLLCKQQKTFRYARFLAKRLNTSIEFDTPLGFRGAGWPGRAHVGNRSIEWVAAAGLAFGRRLWTVPGCEYCGNSLGEGADLTLADPWGIDTAGPGRTMIMVRSEAGRELLNTAGSRLCLEVIDVERARLSVDWNGILRKQKLISMRLGNPYSPSIARLLYKAGTKQRRLYEWLLDRVRFPEIALKILNRIPFIEDAA
jgi:coenzyme F420-reducing hydrogenase beta subunit